MGGMGGYATRATCVVGAWAASAAGGGYSPHVGGGFGGGGMGHMGGGFGGGGHGGGGGGHR